MKISFPFAILKILAIELPQLEFRLSQLNIANQDLKINNQLLNRILTSPNSTDLVGGTIPMSSSPDSSSVHQQQKSQLSAIASVVSPDDLTFQFIGTQLTHELKQQHQQKQTGSFL